MGNCSSKTTISTTTEDLKNILAKNPDPSQLISGLRRTPASKTTSTTITTTTAITTMTTTSTQRMTERERDYKGESKTILKVFTLQNFNFNCLKLFI